MGWIKGVTAVAVTGITLGLMVDAQEVYGGHILDYFESYDIVGLPEGVVEGANYLSAGGDPSVEHLGPTWGRFGEAITDGVYVSNRPAEVLSGSQSGTLFTDWSLGDSVSTVFFTNDLDATPHTGYRIDIRSNSSSGQQGAGVIAVFSGTVDGKSQTWITDLNVATPQAVTDSTLRFEFDFNPSQYEEVNWPAAEADFYGTLASLDWIGVQVLRENSTGAEAFSIDNLALVPEPGAAIMLAAGAVLIVLPRRSRRVLSPSG